MMRSILALIALLAALALTAPAQRANAQDTASLIADSLSLRGDDTLVAEGNIEVFYQGTRLRARRIVYSRATDSLRIEGPISIHQGEEIILLADSAEMSSDLRDGILTSARLVLNQQLQLAAREVSRVGGRYTRLSDSVASSCQVCAENPTPLWEIRARRVVHDSLERQIHFEDAQFRVLGQPLIYVPRLRMPDPTVERATGWLSPELRYGGLLGADISIPYFIALAPDRDLTLTPRITSRGSYSFAARYRQAFAEGDLTLEGALTRDRMGLGPIRGYAFAEGRFRLGPQTELGFDLAAVSDRTYLDDYDISGQEVLTSELFVERIARDAHSRGRVTFFESLRPGDTNALLPNHVGDLRHVQRFGMPGLGGTGRITFDALAAHRRASDPAGGAGRDMARASVRLDWRRDWMLPGGVLAAGLAEVQADHFAVRHDDGFPGRITRVTPAAAVELRWPWVRQGAGGARHIVEPVAQLVWAPDGQPDTPNEDSLLVEFDEASLFAMHRFPGNDAREAGSRANLGLSWTRHDAQGWSLGVTLGRVLRLRDPDQFTALSGLDGIRSNWLAAARFDTAGGLSISGRSLIDGSGRIAKGALRFGVEGERLSLASTLAHLDSEPAEGRAATSTELNLDTSWQVTPNWRAMMDGGYDIATRQPARLGLGAQFRNECLAVDVSLSRRFASSSSVGARTSFGLSVDLIGFGGQPAGPARGCVR